jgi:biotin carboxyl carrier protein
MPSKEGPRPGRGDVAGPVETSDPRAVRDHESISRLTEDLLPALIARLGASGLGEIEVREGAWKARLRKRAGAEGRSGTAGHAHGHGRGDSARVAEEAERRAREAAEAEQAASQPIMATSPAVGIFQPRKDVIVGARIRAGDRIGSVDVLGVREDVVAPIDGVIGTTLVEAGEAVEFGQELIRIELPENARGLDAGSADREAAAVLGEA